MVHGRLLRYNYHTGRLELDPQYLTQVFGAPTEDSLLYMPPFEVHAGKTIGGKQWWSQPFISKLEHMVSDERVKVGRSLARNYNGALALEMRPGLAQAVFVSRFSFDAPFIARLHFPLLENPTRQKIIDAMSARASVLASFLAGAISGDIEAIFAEAGENFTLPHLRLECQCGYNQPCIHTLAAAYLLVPLIEGDPFLMFHLRGLPKRILLPILRGDPPMQPRLPRNFWAGASISPSKDTRPSLTAQVNKLPDNLRSDILPLYSQISKAAQNLLSALPARSESLEPLFPPPSHEEPDEVEIPPEALSSANNVIELVRRVCLHYLDAEYAQLGERMAHLLALRQPDQISRGQAASWAAGIVYMLANINHLFSHMERGALTEAELAAVFGVSKATVQTKARTIQSILQPVPGDLRFTHSRVFREQSRTWLVLHNGIVVDARELPPELYQQARQAGWIPEDS